MVTIASVQSVILLYSIFVIKMIKNFLFIQNLTLHFYCLCIGLGIEELFITHDKVLIFDKKNPSFFVS